MEIKIGLVPINETANAFTTTLDKIHDIAHIAIKLEPIQSFTEIDGYTDALWEEMQNRKYSDQELFTIYDKLIHATNGFNLLKADIQLLLLERKMHEEGIDPDTMNTYNKIQRDYQRLIDDLQV